MVVLKTILVPIDFEQESLHALSYARELARQFNATVHVLHVVSDVFAMRGGTEGSLAAFPRLQATVEESARQELEKLTSVDDGVGSATAVVVASPSPAQAIAAYARDGRVDLIVMGTHGRGGTAGVLMGSVAERVVRTAPCPVLTVRRPEHECIAPQTVLERSNA